MEEVYLRLQSKKENTRKHHLRNKKFLWPSIATIAVLFLSLFLVITQYNQQKENKGIPDKFEIDKMIQVIKRMNKKRNYSILLKMIRILRVIIKDYIKKNMQFIRTTYMKKIL